MPAFPSARYPRRMDLPETDHAAAGSHPSHLRGWLLFAAVAWLLSLAATWWLASNLAAPAPMPLEAAAPGAGEANDSADLRALRQQVATLKRSDEISRN